MFDYTAILLIVYAVFMSRNLVAHGRLFFERLRYELKIESQRELIGLLLNDFQEHASDWLWETDAERRADPRLRPLCRSRRQDAIGASRRAAVRRH